MWHVPTSQKKKRDLQSGPSLAHLKCSVLHQLLAWFSSTHALESLPLLSSAGALFMNSVS